MEGRWFVALPLALGLLSSAPPAGAATAAGVKAYQQARHAKAVQELTAPAEAGDALAQYYLGLALRAQIPKPAGRFVVPPVETDPAQQASPAWVARAAAQGLVAARRQLGEDLEQGFGVAVDYPAALAAMQQAAEAGNAEAIETLARWHHEGHIVPPDRARAAEWRRRLPEAQRTVDPATQQRLDSFRNLADLASRYLESQPGYSHADFLRSAEAGDPTAAMKVAENHRRGRNAIGDCALAAQWYERAGTLGLAEGFKEAADLFHAGDCVPQDLPRALGLYERGAAAADAASLYRAARMNLFGHGRAADPAAAYTQLLLLRSIEPDGRSQGTAMLGYAGRQLDEARRAAAAAAAAEREPALRAIVARATAKSTLRTLTPTAAADPSWSHELTLVDASGRCAGNYLGRCDWVPFDVRLTIQSRATDTLACRLLLDYQPFGASERRQVERKLVLLPGGSTSSTIGGLRGEVDPARSGVTCRHVAQPTAADGTCVVRPGPGPGPVYPQAALRAGEQGVVRLWVQVARSGERAAQVELAQGSQSASLDAAALAYARETTFETNCPGQALVLPLEFRLAE